jgi:transcriptional regulator with XRE-family HTH domain
MRAEWDETKDPREEAARLGALHLGRAVELRQRQNEIASGQGPPATAGMILLGRYVRRSRLLADLSQRQLAAMAGVSQSMVSRVERGVEPAVEVARLIALVRPLARLFPFGACPHDHNCAWQPVKPVEDSISDPTRFVRKMLGLAGEE